MCIYCELELHSMMQFSSRKQQTLVLLPVVML